VVNEQNTISITARHSGQRRQRMVPALVKMTYPWADTVIGNSRGVAQDLVRITGLPDTRIKVLYNPVVTPELHEKLQARPAHPWLLPGQPPVVLAVGRLTAQKDFPTLIRAFAEVRKSRPARLLILGEGPDRGALEELVLEFDLSKDVSLAGFVDNPYPYMARASLFVLSSRWEGLPTVLIEALYCGVPVVATDCPSGPREILAEGKYGALVPMQDVPTLAQTIAQALDGRTPRPSVESWQPYELENIVDQYVQTLLGDD
jgi:glycosyltransferase involved in cell wall biosynthesis